MMSHHAHTRYILLHSSADENTLIHVLVTVEHAAVTMKVKLPF